MQIGEPTGGLEFRLLGAFEVVVDGRTLDIGSAKQRLLLAMLAVAGNRPVGVDALAEELWGDGPPADVAAGLQNLVSRVRRALAAAPPGSAAVVGRGPGYVLEVDAERVDAARFGRMSAQARDLLAAGAAHDAARVSEQALRLWRGPALAGLAERPFARVEAARLEEARREATETWADALLTAGRPADAVMALEPLVAEAPFREDACGRLMLALYRSGRQADALSAYRDLRRALAEELGLEPGPALRRLESQVLTQSQELHEPGAPRPELLEAFPARASPAEHPHNLPTTLGRFLGRSNELGELRALLDVERLVTLWGPGGAGKTRLSLELGARSLADFADGVWFVELAPLDRDDLVAPAVMGALGMVSAGSAAGPLDEVCGYLAPRTALIVLDNCEHLLGAVAELTHGLLVRCPGVRVVASSRETLRVAGEHVWPARSMSLPPEAADLAAIACADAVALFCERARAAHPAFALTEANAAAVVEICRRLDGIPLALELAAARVRVLGVRGLAARLDDRFRVLTAGVRTADPRHRTLWAAVDWSHELMPAAERELLARLSVFPGGFDLAAAEGVGASDSARVGFEVLDLLARLVDKSLVIAFDGENGEVRYRLLETIRQYGAEKLAAADRTWETRRRHLDHYLGSAIVTWRARYASDHDWIWQAHRETDNYRFALEWALAQGDVDAALRLASTLWAYWSWAEDPKDKPQEWLQRALGLPGQARNAQAADAMVGLAWYSGDASLARGAVALAEELGEPTLLIAVQFCAATAVAESEPAWARALMEAAVGRDEEGVQGEAAYALSWCHYSLAWSALGAGDARAALAHGERALALAGPIGPGSINHAQFLGTVALAAAALGAADRAEQAAAHTLEVARGLPLGGLTAMAGVRIAMAAALSGRWERVERAIRDLVPLLLRPGTHRWVGDTLELTALLLDATGRPAAAARLLRAADGHRERVREATGGGVAALRDALADCRARSAGQSPQDSVGDVDVPALLRTALDALDATPVRPNNPHR